MSDEHTDTAAQLESVVMRALKSFSKSKPTMTVNTVTMVVTHVAIRLASQVMAFDDFVEMARSMYDAQRRHMAQQCLETWPEPEPQDDENAATPSEAAPRIYSLPPLR